ncbi:GTP-binding protein [Salinisphaera sp. T31B1]|uniref:CobW family GTP-binding protein n=1 Tax=Salinisphaera sp. T31B1 TaxID=727963 RepID=UPI00333FDEDD
MIPTTLLCGFLGAGKTTRINTLIAAGELVNALFLVNDFGRINIDAELIESREDHILRLSNGCACCGIAGDLSAQLREIRDWPQPPEHLVLEASGVARPRPLIQLFGAARGYRLEHAETLVDAAGFERHIGDDAIADIVRAQIREVGHLRINRLEWLDDAARAEVLQHLERLNATATRTIEPGEAPDSPALSAPAAGPARGRLVTESVELTGPVDLAALEELLTNASATLVRAKGLVEAAGRPGGSHVVQVAGGRLRVIAARARSTRALVLIGYPGPALDKLVAALRRL